MTQLRISAKNLGAMSLPEFCPRCFWLKTHAKKLPFQIFPGIFSSIDSYTRRVVHGWIDELGPPAWLDSIGRITGYIDPPSYHTFQMHVEEHDLLLTGAADGILELADGSIAIIDYKTAKYTANQDKLLPMYATQLNGYALIAEHLKMGTVSKLALMYAEPVTDPVTARSDAVRLADGFAMPLAVSIHEVPLDPRQLDLLSRRAREIYDLLEAPARTPGCEDCDRLDSLMRLARKL